ncbi:MAG: metal-dependent hydrolase, partial [Candidatus Aenigmatarchaeota archaeon]
MLMLVHALFGTSIAYLTRFPVFFALLGSIAPDFDGLWAAQAELHRQWFHTPLAGLIIAAAIFAYFKFRKNSCAKAMTFSFLLGWLSHLLIDTTTVFGIMWIYPVGTYYTTGWFRSIETLPNIAISVLSLAIFAVGFVIKNQKKSGLAFPKLKATNLQKASIIFALMMLFLFAFARPKSQFPIGAEIGINRLLENANSYSDKFVTVQGVVTDIAENYGAKSGNAYQRFYLGSLENNDRILIFKSANM